MLDALVDEHGLSAGDLLLANGGSAGGLALWLHLDYINAYLAARLGGRTSKDVAALNAALEAREKCYGKCGLEPSGDLADIEAGAFYLKGIDELYRRTYSRKE